MLISTTFSCLGTVKGRVAKLHRWVLKRLCKSRFCFCETLTWECELLWKLMTWCSLSFILRKLVGNEWVLGFTRPSSFWHVSLVLNFIQRALLGDCFCCENFCKSLIGMTVPYLPFNTKLSDVPELYVLGILLFLRLIYSYLLRVVVVISWLLDCTSWLFSRFLIWSWFYLFDLCICLPFYMIGL